MNNPSDEIKSRLDIVDVLREYIQLKPAGINFRTNCPFHREKTPSFMVSPEKQIWHCFGCGRGGDIFSFVMEMEGLSFVEALRLLAPKAGVELKKVDAKLTSKRNRLLDAVKLAAEYYHRILLKDSQAEAARAYLKRRDFTEETLAFWQIGYSPESWDDLVNFLKNKGFSEDEIFSAGMSIKKEGGGFYNRFRGRIMFPLSDAAGNAVAFTARVSPEKEATEKMGKYINGPQTLIYDKSRILFGLDKAKQEIKKEDLAVLVEGQTDVITAHQHGFKNVVASSGTALTAEQVALLKRYTNNLALAFDRDSAGEMAAERGTREAMRSGVSLKIIKLPSGKDPDECIKNSPDEWRQALLAAKPMMEHYFDKTLAGLDLSEVDNRRRAAKILLPLVARLGNQIEQSFWLKKLSQAIDVPENILRETVTAKKETVGREKDEEEELPASQPKPRREELLSELLLALILKFSQHLHYAFSNIPIDQLAGPGNKDLYRSLVIYYNKIAKDSAETADYAPTGEEGEREDRNDGSKVNYKDFREWLAQNEAPSVSAALIEVTQTKPNNKISQPELLDRLALLADKDFYDYDSDQARKEIIKIVMALKKNYLVNRSKEIEKLIAQTEKEKDEVRVRELLEELKSLAEEINEMEKSEAGLSV